MPAPPVLTNYWKDNTLKMILGAGTDCALYRGEAGDRPAPSETEESAAPVSHALQAQHGAKTGQETVRHHHNNAQERPMETRQMTQPF